MRRFLLAQSYANFSQQADEAVRDSDSGVNSSTTSRTTTPEQRNYQQQQQQQQQQQLQTKKQHEQNQHQVQPQQQQHHQQQQQQQQQHDIPSIAVTATASVDERAEEEDDLDELFSQHRPNALGSRSSLAKSLIRCGDSRESIYSVYSDAGEAHYGRIPVTGDVQFHLTYDYKNSALLVHVKSCRNLAPVDVKRNRSDPYVKTYLLPDKSRAGKRKTKIKKHTLNPTFDEVLKYNITKPELESRVLWLAVWHNDRLGRNDFLGEVTVPLDYYRFENSSPQWYQLAERVPPEQDMSLMVYKGDLFISLKYVTADMVDTSPAKRKSGGSFRRKDKGKERVSNAGEIHVLVREAQNLTAMRGTAGSNPFCKGYLLPDVNHISKQKTPVLKKTTNPQWHHTLVFPGADIAMLSEHALELTVWDHESLSSNDFLGGVRLNLGSGVFQGLPVEWMDARGEEVEAWQAMMDRPGQWVDAQLPLRASMGGQQVKK
ncbi:synaptotagmin-like protein 5 [Plakobranchus ocellatus]|uniref:Synaptotagmin-like protein 5 n=1 Tax=Plakobranchus ocellatus TaxID=259542 RepID=A0AAV4B0M0_9GAST|nr:synaptotagmin-like protein 5 [Plakobranchus ocellatus]